MAEMMVMVKGLHVLSQAAAVCTSSWTSIHVIDVMWSEQNRICYACHTEAKEGRELREQVIKADGSLSLISTGSTQSSRFFRCSKFSYFEGRDKHSSVALHFEEKRRHSASLSKRCYGRDGNDERAARIIISQVEAEGAGSWASIHVIDVMWNEQNFCTLVTQWPRKEGKREKRNRGVEAPKFDLQCGRHSSTWCSSQLRAETPGCLPQSQATAPRLGRLPGAQPQHLNKLKLFLLLLLLLP